MKKEIIEKINENIDEDRKNFIKIPSLSEINKVREDLRFSEFPKSYLEFLLRYGTLNLKIYRGYSNIEISELERCIYDLMHKKEISKNEIKEFLFKNNFEIEELTMNEFLDKYSFLSLSDKEYNKSIREKWQHEEIFAFKTSDAPLGDKNLIESVDDIRNSWGYDFLKNVNLIPFYWMGNGDYLVINLHKYNPKTKEAPVEYFNHEVLHEYGGKKVDFSKKNRITEETGFNSFGEWLEQLVKDDFKVPLFKEKSLTSKIKNLFK